MSLVFRKEFLQCFKKYIKKIMFFNDLGATGLRLVCMWCAHGVHMVCVCGINMVGEWCLSGV
jgi:hypothetical protein